MENTQKKDTGYHLYGMHPVLEAVLSGRQIEKVLLKQGLEGQQFRQLLTELERRGIPFQFVPAERLARFRGGKNQGVVAYLPQIDYMPLEEMVERAFQKDPAPIFVLLDGVSDVRNLGAVARSAECAGAGGIILPAKGGAAINADGVKASAGALLRIGVSKCKNLRIPIYYLKERGFQIIAATEKTDGLIYDVDMKKPTAFVMGSESKGISDSVLTLCDVRARIPMRGDIGSLNVSVAASLMLFEAVRQRTL
ncbi:MAG TPA: 23S rRNA (guanosine(2251)-2'-O)-methyltransferase RlmB [Candidatus Coprenecus pullistercoris]|nr:23S rRNA (guanosine(2251)-2'-O)-methyltransferase RlmB [Candidatus Coprenecus pullistercoris]